MDRNLLGGPIVQLDPGSLTRPNGMVQQHYSYLGQFVSDVATDAIGEVVAAGRATSFARTGDYADIIAARTQAARTGESVFIGRQTASSANEAAALTIWTRHGWVEQQWKPRPSPLEKSFEW